MHEVLEQLYNACDPFKAATDEYYLSCAQARGDNALSKVLLGHLNLANDFIYFLFSGHIGCGKSSELEQLRHRLDHPKAGDRRFFPITLNVSEYLDDFNVKPTDILLAVVTELAATLQDRKVTELKSGFFAKRFQELKEFLGRDVTIDEIEVSLGVLKTNIKLLKRDPTARDQVRAALEAHMTNLLEEVNSIFDQARLKVKNLPPAVGEQPYTDFVLILDNLEKIRGYPGKKDGLESQRQLFIENAPQLTGLKAHIIFTVPLELARADGPLLEHRYGMAPFVLPMIKVIERGTRSPYHSGIGCLRRLLEKRLEKGSLQDVFHGSSLFSVGKSGAINDSLPGERHRNNHAASSLVA